jgi:Acetyltransferase (GNAT) family
VRIDQRPTPATPTPRFLAEAAHHLLLAYDSERPVGFVSGVELTHPDKGTEMFLNELGVDEARAPPGDRTLLVEALVELARERGCYDMFVFADDTTSPGSRPTAARAAGTRHAR